MPSGSPIVTVTGGELVFSSLILCHSEPQAKNLGDSSFRGVYTERSRSTLLRMTRRNSDNVPLMNVQEVS